MTLNIEDWHLRFTRQAQWTSNIRKYIYNRISFNSAKSILDVGCSTGALESEIFGETRGSITGLDIDYPSLFFAKKISDTLWTCADGLNLPFAANSYDVSLCHYLLLWLSNPLSVLLEMKRVTKDQGFILILAEPDYTHRIDFPAELTILGKMQSDSLKDQGADPGIGSSIGGLLTSAGFEVIETGLAGGQWTPQPDPTEDDMEWQVLSHDLPGADLERYKQIDRSARLDGSRVLFVPVFYAIGRKIAA